MVKRTNAIYLRGSRLLRNEESPNLDVFRANNDSQEEPKNYCCELCCNDEVCRSEEPYRQIFLEVFEIDILPLIFGTIVCFAGQILNFSPWAPRGNHFQVLRFLPSLIFLLYCGTVFLTTFISMRLCPSTNVPKLAVPVDLSSRNTLLAVKYGLATFFLTSTVFLAIMLCYVDGAIATPIYLIVSIPIPVIMIMGYLIGCKLSWYRCCDPEVKSANFR